MHYADVNTSYIQNNEKLENHKFSRIKENIFILVKMRDS